MKHKNKKPPTTYYLLPTKNEKGFTLLEVLISTFILTVAIGTMLALITDNLRTIHVVQRSVVAANLAQEGVEVARGIRDGNWIQAASYDDGFIDGSYCVNYDSQTLIDCGTNFALYWDSTADRYTHSGALSTPFEREIIITNDSDPDGDGFIRVESVVRWDSREVVAETHLYDWH